MEKPINVKLGLSNLLDSTEHFIHNTFSLFESEQCLILTPNCSLSPLPLRENKAEMNLVRQMVIMMQNMVCYDRVT